MSIDQFFISNISNDINHKEQLEYILASAEEITIIAPFITKNGLDVVTSSLKQNSTLRLITEINPRGIASNSQSPRLLHKVSKRINTSVYFTSNSKLHSKIYIADNNILITSANLTSGGLKSNFETGILFSNKTKAKFSSNMQAELLERLNESLIPYILKDSIKLTSESIAPWIEVEDQIQTRLKEYESIIEQFEESLPQKGFTTFSGKFDGRDVSTQILASFKEFEFKKESWDAFYRYSNPSYVHDLREDLDTEINPILKDIFHSVKQSHLCEINFTNLRDDIFSHNRLVTKFLPTYRNLYLTKAGIGGNNFKKHVYYPAFVLNMSIKDESKIFQIRVGVEEDISTEPLCFHAKVFLQNLLKNSSECIKRFNEMNGEWFLIHGQDRQQKRKSIPLKNLSLEMLEQICNLYLNTQNPADIAIGHNYYWSDDSILRTPKKFISSLASDLNHLNYFFELAHE